jgi:hypothetical protein
LLLEALAMALSNGLVTALMVAALHATPLAVALIDVARVLLLVQGERANQALVVSPYAAEELLKQLVAHV